MAGRPRKSAKEHAAKGNYRPSRHGALPVAASTGEYLPWLRKKIAELQGELDKVGPAAKGYGQLVKSLDTFMERVAKIELRNAVSNVTPAAVVSRPKTKLDKLGRPK